MLYYVLVGVLHCLFVFVALESDEEGSSAPSTPLDSAVSLDQLVRMGEREREREREREIEKEKEKEKEREREREKANESHH